MARHCKQELKVTLTQDTQGTWVIQFQAGYGVDAAAVKCTLDTFVQAPRIVLEPFTEELIRVTR